MRRSPLIALASLAVAAALAASACGGGDDGGGSASGRADPEQYASDVCGAISSWQNELQSSVSSMTAKLGTSPTPAQIKTQLVAFMETTTKSTDAMVQKVRAAGPPDVEDGEALQRDLVAGLTDAQTAFREARDEAKNLPADDRVAFQREASALGSTLTEQGNAIGQTFENLSTKYDSSELNAAFDKEPACNSL